MPHLMLASKPRAYNCIDCPITNTVERKKCRNRNKNKPEVNKKLKKGRAQKIVRGWKKRWKFETLENSDVWGRTVCSVFGYFVNP